MTPPLFGRAEPASIPRFLIASRRPGFDQALGEFVAGVKTVAKARFGTAGPGEQTQNGARLPLSSGGFLSLALANVRSELLVRLYGEGGLDEGWVVSFVDLPRKSKINENTAKDFYREIAGEANRLLANPSLSRLFSGADRETFVFSVI